MKRLLKWVGLGLAGLVALLTIGAVGILLLSWSKLNKTYDVPLTEIAVPSDSAAAAVGRRLAAIRGCTGCHEADLGGQVLVDEPLLGRFSAADLTRVAAVYTNAELERAIRHGIRSDGHSVLGMPSAMFYHLSDADLGAVIAFLRSQPRVDRKLPTNRIGPLGHFGLALGKYIPEAAMIDHDAARLSSSKRTDQVAYGQYLAKTSCTECHGMDLRGSPGGTPGLSVAATYSADDFRRLMRTGVPLGGRQLRLMAEVARGRFAHFTDDEVSALHAFLQTLARSDTTAKE